MSTINVIVKTLDGKNHEFSVPDNITVNQFKSVINEKMDIDVDRQRLLFQGRVLQDDNQLASYNVAGNVMHLVTRPPPSQTRPQPEPSTEREENSDINRDQIRNILNDVFGNFTDINNPLGVSVNNEGNRVDITVNMPSSNRLSLARLRQNYVHRLMSQARDLLDHIRDPTNPAPRPDRERLYQANAYDLAQNEERITEVTSQPLPIHNLADMVRNVRNLWRDADPQLEVWENVLRRENLPESISNSDREMQRMHDSASRYIHLFSHMLHIMSDYLVEFQHNSVTSHMHVHRSATTNTTATNCTTAAAATSGTSETATPTNEAATSTSIDDNVGPLTGGFGESALPHSESSSDAGNTSSTVTGATANETAAPTVNTAPQSTTDTNDRSRYLYVFSEMPAQLLQVRLDVDSTIPITSVGNVPVRNLAPRSTEFRPINPAASSEQTTTAAGTGTGTAAPTSQFPVVSETINRIRRRDNQLGSATPATTVENLLRTTLQEPFTTPPSSRFTNGSTTARSIRNGTQLIENVDPYVRCQSRHFQNPSNLRSGAVISTFGGIRLRESSRTRPRPTDGTGVSGTAATSAGNTNIHHTNTNTNTLGSGHAPQSTATDNRDGDPIRSFIGGLINSIFSNSGDSSSNTATDNTPPGIASVTATVSALPIPIPNIGNVTATGANLSSLPNDFTRFLQSISSTGTLNLNAPLGELFPEIFNSHETDTENNITNQIIHLVVNRLTMIDFTQIIHGVYNPLNSLRIPLQDLLQRHQQQCDGSRERMLENVVMDLEFFNRVYMSIFDQLRGPGAVSGLSDDARNNFNSSIDIPRTINNLNRHHARVVIDTILRSPTDQGFGHTLMSSMLSHHNESLALLDIICNNNDELRQYMVRAFVESLMSSMDDSPYNISQSIGHDRNQLGFDLIFGNVNSRLFRRPEHLSQLRENVMASYVVYIDLNRINENNIDINSARPTDDNDEMMEDSLDDMVNSLSGNIIQTRSIPTEIPRASELMDVCSYQQHQQDINSLPSNNHSQPNGGAAWQTVLPPEWIDIVSRDSSAPIDQHTIGIPYSDAYVSGMPPKRRKIILNQRSRSIQRAPELMRDCIDQAIQAAGLADSAAAAAAAAAAQSIELNRSFGPGLTSSFQELVSDHVRNRLVEEQYNFPQERFPSTEQHFNRKKRNDDDKKNNN